MTVKTVESLQKRPSADALIIPFYEGKKPAFAGKLGSSLFSSPLKAGDFTGKKEEVLCHYPQTGKEKRLVLVGLGKKGDLTSEGLRRAYAKALSSVKKKAKSVNVQLPQEGDIMAAVEGVLLTNYVYDTNKTEKDKSVGQITFITEDREGVKRVEMVCEGVFLTRNLAISNADTVTPTFLSKMAKELAAEHSSIKTTVLDGKQIKKEKLGLLEAVSRASSEDPALIILEYTGNPKSKETSAIVGKGVTYDTGGLSLKPTSGMLTMRDDMSGAATVLGTMHVIARLKLPINVIGVIGSTENSIGSKSYKIGDVYTSYSGVHVEITNTDAEGRLVLADALSYLQMNYGPKRIIDIATLTGGAVVALGEEVTAIMSNDDVLSQQLIDAGEQTYERLWRLPLYDEYDDLLKSKFADIKNSGERKASPIQGGIFLKRFIGKVDWAHLDIAGTSFPDNLKPYHPVQATGVGVRLLTQFFSKLCL